jgi:hypothetical protein
MSWFHELVGWWQSLSTPATFFFSLPFMVAAAALLNDVARSSLRGAGAKQDSAASPQFVRKRGTPRAARRRIQHR